LLVAPAKSLLVSAVLAWSAMLGWPSPVHAQGIYSVRGPWVDDQDRVYDLGSLRDSYTVVTMAYGACRRVCSLSLRVVEQIAVIAEQRQLPLHVLVVGLDPTQDKPSDWAAMRAQRGPALRRVEFLSGTAASTRRLAQQLGVRYWRYGEHTMHDFRIVMVAPGGQVVSAMSKYDDDLNLLLP
jgi:cytochrome oxidase Cu insertion factor (SCO1/SenC/PrrC family)